jgi:transposase
MGQRLVACDREQSLLMPPDVREWLPPRHLAWFVIDAVAEMNLEAFYAAYRVDGRSRPPYDPAMMVAVLLYAYARGIRSSRVIERACEEDVAFRVLAAQQRPDHATIARFVERHQEAIAGLFRARSAAGGRLRSAPRRRSSPPQASWRSSTAGPPGFAVQRSPHCRNATSAGTARAPSRSAGTPRAGGCRAPGIDDRDVGQVALDVGEEIVPIVSPGGSHRLFLVFPNANTYSLNWVEFVGAGVGT